MKRRPSRLILLDRSGAFLFVIIIHYIRSFAGQPAQVREVRRHGQLDVPERRLCVLELEDPVPGQADLHLLWPVLRGGQPLQEVPHLHPNCGEDVPGKEEERGAASLVGDCGDRLPQHAPEQQESVNAGEITLPPFFFAPTDLSLFFT